MLREIREAEEQKRKWAEEAQKPVAKRGTGPDPHAQTRPWVAEWGIDYTQVSDGSYCQRPSTFRASKQNRPRVLPVRSQPNNDFDPWDV
jgi:hypothetical protein